MVISTPRTMIFALFCVVNLLLHTVVFCTDDVGTTVEESHELLNSAVITLDGTNLTESIVDGTWFLEFYAPWCGHCQHLAPTWETVAQELQHHNIKTAKIDATQLEQLMVTKWSIRGYPTLLLVKGNDLYDFSQAGVDRSVENLVEFARNPSGDAQPVPAPPKFWDPIIYYVGTVVNDLMFILTRKLAAVGVVSLFAFLFGILFGLVCLSPKPKPKVQPQPQPKPKKE